MIGKNVLIRSYASGVHFGTLLTEQFTPAGKVVTLENSRRVHYWSGAASLSQMANEGIKNPQESRVAQPLPLIEVVNVIETIVLSPEASENLQNQPVWKI